MKIGNQPKRWGKPSQKFLDQQAQREEQAYLKKKSDIKRDLDKGFLRGYQNPSQNKLTMGVDLDPNMGKTLPPVDNRVRIYLDDERPCPEGWILARTPKEFFDLLKGDKEFLDRVTHLSLDWYLGHNHRDGVQVTKELAELFFTGHYEEKPFLPNLKAVGFHSSDREQAARMHIILNEALQAVEPERVENIRMRLRTPLR
jgi:hypothetical protein